MQHRRTLAFFFTLSFLLALGCGTDGDGSTASKDEARERLGRGDYSGDFCEDYGWYGDKECDPWCPRPDPDCNGCLGDNPAGCRSDAECGDGETCVVDADECIPSACSCLDNGEWICTADCGAGVCQPNSACMGDNPQGCTSDSQCTDGEVCGGSDICRPSSCSCTDRGWLCTEDCGGGVCGAACEGPNPAGCTDDDDCVDGAVCRDSDECHPGSCSCTDGGWLCTEDCVRRVCEADTGMTCDGPNPQGCTRDNQCGDGQVCGGSDICRPSSCSCTDRGWFCTEDCGGGVCQAACEGPNPAGCSEDEDCDDGERCDRMADCLPSSCGCNDGMWICTSDCGGGLCVPE